MKLSCVVPILNEENNVRNFLEGYSIQSEKFYELIFVDGNSKDKTIEIIKKYQKKIPEIKILTCDKKGPSAARNTGLDNATGDYVTFFDADWKFLSKNTIKQILSYVDTNIYFFVYSNVKIDFSGLRKYIYLKDKNVAFILIKKSECPKWDEELGFGEDRIFFNDFFKLKHKKFELSDNDIPLSRAQGEMGFDKLLRRYMWYGRTIPKYIKKSKDYVQLFGYIIYVISIIPLFWPIPFFRGFIRGIKELKYGLDVPFGMGIVEIITAIGISLGFMQWLVGINNIGRDL